MFDKLRIGNSAKVAHKFTPVHPDPKIGKKHGISLMLYGKHSEQYRNCISAFLRKAGPNDGRLTTEEAVEQSANLIVACCSGWGGVTAKKDKKTDIPAIVPYSPEKLREILIDGDFWWLRLDAERFIRNDDNFF